MEALITQAQHWTSQDFCEQTRQTMQHWMETRNETELSKAFSKRISFGTAGLRARMAPGWSYMNHLTVQQASQGLARYLQQVYGEVSQGVVIGYDGRHYSKDYAHLSAAVFRSQNIPVYLYSYNVITPMVPYAVLKLRAVAGIMVTASHNPKQDNGYKVYWTNGAQITEPHDKHISDSILANLSLWEIPARNDLNSILSVCNTQFADIVIENYLQESYEKFCRRGARNSSAVRVVYTAMHGVGYSFISRLFEKYHFPSPVSVPEQQNPDPEFPTVAFPNPEEGRGALKLAIELSERENIGLVLANDPDADRFAAAEKQRDGSWKIFSGDELAIFLFEWEVSNYKGTKPAAMVASTVSSKMTQGIAEFHNCRWEETLTGFKWIINKSLELEAEGYSTVFSFEEAIGFCIGDLVRDKDGVTTAAVFYELYLERCVEAGLLLSEFLDRLRQKYGYYLTKNKYFLCYDPEVIRRVFEDIRFKGYPSTVGRFAVKHVRDLTVGFDSSQPSSKPILPISASTQMITFTFENGAVVTLRTSGTEPKIKYYTELKGSDYASTWSELSEVVDSIISELLRPDYFGLIAPTD
jgi:phosphomannomutase